MHQELLLVKVCRNALTWPETGVHFSYMTNANERASAPWLTDPVLTGPQSGSGGSKDSSVPPKDRVTDSSGRSVTSDPEARKAAREAGARSVKDRGLFKNEPKIDIFSADPEERDPNKHRRSGGRSSLPE